MAGIRSASMAPPRERGSYQRPGFPIRMAGPMNPVGDDTMTSIIRRAALTALVFALASAASLHAAGEGRIIATVADEAGNPIQGAKVVLTRPGTAYKLEKTTDKKGQVMLLILDATQEYQVHAE